MSIEGKIKTLFSDQEKAKALFPRTKVSAVSDDDGTGLNVLLENINDKADSKLPLSGGTMTGNITFSSSAGTGIITEIPSSITGGWSRGWDWKTTGGISGIGCLGADANFTYMYVGGNWGAPWMKVQPNGNVTATKFIGALQGNADTATKAIQDGNGHTITISYAHRQDISANGGFPSGSTTYGMLLSANPHVNGSTTGNDNYYLLVDSVRKFWVGTKLNAETTPSWVQMASVAYVSDNYATKTEMDKCYNSTVSRTANTVLAAPSDANGVASFRTLDYLDLRNRKVVDLTSSTYDQNTFYPVTGNSIPSGGFHRFILSVQLDYASKPSWAEHDGGFNVNIDILAKANGWGTTNGAMICFDDSYGYSSGRPATFYQMTNSSTPVFWLRGGGKYTIDTDYPCTWTPRTSTYTTSSQSVSPQTSISPAPGTGTIYANITGNAANATTASSCTGNAATATTASKLGTSTLGSSTQPIYLSSGTATACSTYAGGTAVTLNGSSKAASTASFYAPTSTGTAGYALFSSGAAPIWASSLLRSTSYTNSLGFNGASYHTITGSYAIAAGYYAYAKSSQVALGHYNMSDTPAGSTSGTSGMAFMIGNGTSSSARANAFYVTYAGVAWAKSSHTNGSDYAEYFEWTDGNPNNEDRCGYFVTMENDKIKIASESDYILGVVSGNPSVLGNSADDTWQGRFLTDEFDRPLVEEYEYEEEEEINGETVLTIKTGTKYKENPDYDSSIHYIQRADRSEWDAIGMVGVLAVRDDGTCQVNGFCKVAEGGIATASTTGYRVIKRVNDHIIKIIFK